MSIRMGLRGRLPWYPCCIQSLAGSSLQNLVLGTKDGLLSYAPNGSKVHLHGPREGKQEIESYFLV